MALTGKQREYLQNAHHRWNVKTGATGSGKSFVDMAATIPKRLIAMRGEGLAVMLGNTRSTLERNILEPMREMWPGLIGHIRADNTVDMFGRKVYALGADNKKQVARIQGSTLEYAYGDEVTTWSPDVFTMLKSRLRCDHSHFDGTCNPDGPKHWFKTFLDSDADIYHQHYTLDDGVLPQKIKAELRREYSGTVYFQRYILGLWVAAEGSIYRPFVDNKSAFLLDVAPPINRAVIGVDFGGGTSAHAFCCVGYSAGMSRLVVLRDYRRKDAADPGALARDFCDFVRVCQSRWPAFEAYCDSAEQTLINGLRVEAARQRLGINIRNARKIEIYDRIRATCILMASGRFFVMRDCLNTIDALESAVWDGKYTTQDVRLDDGTTNIDNLDAMEYAFERDIHALIDRGLARQ